MNPSSVQDPGKGIVAGLPQLGLSEVPAASQPLAVPVTNPRMTDRGDAQPSVSGSQDCHPLSAVTLSPTLSDSEPSDDEEEKEDENESAVTDDDATVLSHMLDKGMEETTMKYLAGGLKAEYASLLSSHCYYTLLFFCPFVL